MQTYQDVAACLVDGAGGFAVVAGQTSQHPNVVSAVRNAKGDYTITISDGIDILDVLPIITATDTLATGGEYTFKVLNDTTFQVKWFDNAGAAQDQGFWCGIRRMGVGAGS